MPRSTLTIVPYFNFMFVDSSRQEDANKIYFPEVDPEVFEILTEWVETHKLRGIMGIESNFNIRYECTWSQPKLYALAQKLGLKELMNDIMHMWISLDKSYDTLPTLDIINEVYSLLPEGSPPRKYASRALWLSVVAEQSEYDGIYPVAEFEELVNKHPNLLEDVEHWIDEYGTEENLEKDPRRNPKDFLQIWAGMPMGHCLIVEIW